MTKSKLLLALALAVLPIAAYADTTIHEDASSVVYSQGDEGVTDWTKYTDPTELFGAEYSSNLEMSTGPTFKGATVAVTFNGTGITWVGIKGPNYGIASYSIDGGTSSTVDNYTGTRTVNQSVVLASGLTAGPHVANIQLTDTKNASSSNYFQSILGFTIAGSSAAGLPLSSGTIEPYSGLAFTGTWSSGTDPVGYPSDLAGGHCWSNTAGSTASWSFTGNLIEVYGRPDLEDGNMDVYIDSAYVATVDLHDGTVDNDAVNSSLLFAKQLSSGSHTIKLVCDGTHDGYATNTFVQIDELVAFSGGGGSGGSLSGSDASAATTYNLTTLGTTDWRVWAVGAGLGNSGNTDTKSGGGTISNFTTTGTGSFDTWYDGGRFNSSWTNGTPTGTGSSQGYLFAGNGGTNPGYVFTAPASTTSQTLYVLVGGDNSSTCVLNAVLSDGSAPDYSNTDTYSGNGAKLYTITYKAGSVGAHLTVTYYKSGGGSTACADLIAAWIGGSAPTGSLSGSVATAATTYNMTTTGTTDWRSWAVNATGGGFSSATDDKSSGGGKISNYTQTGASGGNYDTWIDSGITFSWTDGAVSPTTDSADHGYLWENADATGGSRGWTFTVPASTTTQTLTVITGGNEAITSLNAHLGDGSAADYNDTGETFGSTTAHKVYTITYKAGSTTTLTITLLKTGNNGTTNGSVNLYGAMLH